MTPELHAPALALARAAIAHGLAHDRAPYPVALDELPAGLRETGASFVTLRAAADGALRGCVGRLVGSRPLAEDIAANAQSAAFEDTRFRPLTADELEAVTISISVLTAPEPIDFRDEADLLAQLVPGQDGLILREGSRRATYLPSVWEQLPEPQEFLCSLKRKMGVASDHWSDAMQAERYRTISFGE